LLKWLFILPYTENSSRGIFVNIPNLSFFTLNINIVLDVYECQNERKYIWFRYRHVQEFLIWWGGNQFMIIKKIVFKKGPKNLLPYSKTPRHIYRPIKPYLI
jgi:hypothetical protein